MKFFSYLKENDPLSILLSLSNDFSDVEIQAKKKIKEIENVVQDLTSQMSLIEKNIKDTQSKTYKDNKTKVHYGDDKDVNSRSSSLTIGQINQRKKQKSIESLIDYYNEMSKLKSALESAIKVDIDSLNPKVFFSKEKFTYSGMNKYVMRLMNDKSFKFKNMNIRDIKTCHENF